MKCWPSAWCTIRWTIVLLLGAIAAPAQNAGDNPGRKPGQKPAGAPQTDSPALQKLRAVRAARPGKSEEFRNAMVAYIQEEVASKLLFAGQHDALRSIDGAAALLHPWVGKPPVTGGKALDFRLTCMRALRDIHQAKAPDGLMTDLRKLADTDRNKQVRDDAAYALAQFGDRERLTGMMQELARLTESKNATQRARGYSGLANLHYQVRDFAAAASAFRNMLTLYEAKKIMLRGADLQYFNAAGSMALAGETDDALAYLRKAFGPGKNVTRKMLTADPDLASLRQDPRFDALVVEHFGRKEGKGGNKQRLPDRGARLRK